MARYKGTQASHLYEKSMHTLCTIIYEDISQLSIHMSGHTQSQIVHVYTCNNVCIHVHQRGIFCNLTISQRLSVLMGQTVLFNTADFPYKFVNEE